MIAPARIHAALLAAVLAAATALAAPAWAQGYLQLSAGDEVRNRPIYLGVDKSMVIELPRAAGDVLVSNPAIADAVLRTSRRLYLIGVKLGQANVFLFDTAGEEIASFDIYVEADLTALNQLLAEAITDGYVRADAMNGNIVLRGQVASASSSARAQEITVGMLQGFSAGTETEGGGEGGGGEAGGGGGGSEEKRLVNLLTITGEEQVALKVTIAEVEREVSKQLGINLTAAFGDGDGFGFNTGTNVGGGGLSPIPFNGGGFAIGYLSGSNFIAANLEALEETNMIRTLAEPTLTAVSGETAEFLAGGEFGYRVFSEDEGDDGDASLRTTVSFREFGVKLAFTPVVLSAGRISIKVRTSVSEISGAIDGIPTLDTNRAETTVELPSGGAFVIGGMIQESTRRNVTGFPGLQHLPILGALFSSKDFLQEETELVIIVTPYLVKPVAPKDLGRPDENLVMSSDAETYFLNRLSKVYGKAAEAPAGTSAGQVGFTFD
ncbi:MAG: type II and III secretion system protein family protein [Pseudomonadota bacterium]|nr:type II and III secretion system protein family protein [Pseudomonadota bacterium]